MQSADAPVSRCTSLHARDCVRLGPNLVYPFITALARPALHEFLSFVRVCFSAVLVAWTAVVLRVRPSVHLLVAALCVLSLCFYRLAGRGRPLWVLSLRARWVRPWLCMPWFLSVSAVYAGSGLLVCVSHFLALCVLSVCLSVCVLTAAGSPPPW